jgi:hypothetical protein
MVIMRMLLGGLGAVVSLFLITAQTPAAAEAVNCPLTTAQRAITNSLPSGWYTTPVRSRLTETRVMNIGDQQTMACVYGDAATVLREVPAGQVCTARSGGFECGSASAPAPAPASEVHSSGAFTVRGTYDFDLDGGAEAPRASSDFWYEIIRDGETYFTPRGAARIAAMGATEPSYAGCTSATLAAARTRIETASGGWFCFRTNEGRIGQFHVDGVDRFTRPVRMTITYSTW